MKRVLFVLDLRLSKYVFQEVAQPLMCFQFPHVLHPDVARAHVLQRFRVLARASEISPLQTSGRNETDCEKKYGQKYHKKPFLSLLVFFLSVICWNCH